MILLILSAREIKFSIRKKPAKPFYTEIGDASYILNLKVVVHPLRDTNQNGWESSPKKVSCFVYFLGINFCHISEGGEGETEMSCTMAVK